MVLPRRRPCRSRSTAPRSTPPASSTTRPATPTPSTPESMPGRSSRRPRRLARPGPARPRGRRRPRDLGARPAPRRRDGRPRAGPRERGVRRRCPTRPCPGLDPRRRHRRRARGDGGGEPRCPHEPLARRRARRRAGAAGAHAVVPPRRRGLGRRARSRSIDTVADPASTLGIPTWHYGHEPSNAFATAIAKYFRNATREAILLEVCDAGIVFLPGAAGTVQEVFQDACENYYADVSSVAPMVLVGREHWTERYPAWPLLAALARGTRDGAARAPRRLARGGGGDRRLAG